MKEKDVPLWTDEQALVHVESQLEAFKTERLILATASRAGSLWGRNQDSDSALFHLTELIKKYERFVRVLSNSIRSHQ